MPPIWLQPLLAAVDANSVHSLIQTYRLTISDVVWLKEYSAQYYFDQPSEAVSLARAAQQLAYQLPSPARALGDWTLANALMFADQYQHAADLYTTARQIYLSVGETLAAARMGVGQVWALAYLGQFATALELAFDIEPVLIASAVPADLQRLGGLYNNLGITHELMGQFEEALGAYDRKLALLPSEETLQQGRVQQNRGVALTWLNAFSEALSAFARAEAAFAASKSTADLSRLWFNRGILYTCRTDYTAASNAFQTAQDLLADQAEPLLQAECELYDGLSRLQANVPPDNTSIAGWRRLQVIFAHHGPLAEEGLAWLGLARSYQAQNRVEAAESALQKAFYIVETGGDSTLAWQIAFYRAELAEQQGDEQQAIVYYRQSLDEIESIRHRLQSDVFRATFLTDKLSVYQQLVHLHIRRGEMEAALAVMERGRSRLLLERLMSRLTDDLSNLAGHDVPELTQLQTLLTEIESLSRRMQGNGLGERGGWLVEGQPEQQSHLRRLELEATAVIHHLQHLPSRQWPFALQPFITLSQLQDTLGETALVYYYQTPGWVNCLLITCDQVINYPALVCLADVDKTQRSLAAATERALGIAAHYGLARFNRYLLPLLADAEKYLGQFYDWLWRPLANHLPEDVLIIPEGTLHYLPFHAFYDGASTSPAYVIERHTVSYVPSATIWDWCRRLKPQGEDMLLMGYGDSHLPQVTAELEALRQRWPQAIHLAGQAATTAVFHQFAPQSRLIHLAAHARFRADEVMLSAFTLADRPLTLLEISRLSLSAELVVLSGCETGSGSLQGNDLFSLATGFLGAGVRALLVTLWRVDDVVTEMLMNRFYSEWAAGVDPATALRQAQRWLIQQSRLQPSLAGCRHPAYWAPFAILGAV